MAATPVGFTRRTLLARAAVGLTGGVFASLLGACSSAAPSTAPAAGATSKPAAAAAPAGARGSGGALRILMWQGPTILNPHLSQGTKDSIAGRFCCEPLMTVSGDGKFTPVLAAEVPSKDSGGLSADGKTATYKLKPGIKWADGEPFTADDAVFTPQYVTNTQTAATTLGLYVDLDKVEAVDPTTVRLT